MKPTTNFFGNLGRRLVRSLVRLYYPRIKIDALECLKTPGPILFVANHANSLIDPVIIGIVTNRPVHFLAKAPLFEVPVVGAIMQAVGMIPAFRGQDNKKDVRRNLESLDVAASKLADGLDIGIFPEGKSHDVAHVEQVRSGTARIAVKAVKGGAQDLRIIPIGINYQRKEQFRSSIWVRVGQPIPVRDRLKAQPEKERQAIRELTTEIDAALKQVVIHLSEENWEPFVDELEILDPASRGRFLDPISALRQRKRIADAINHYATEEPARVKRIAVAILRHRKNLSESGLDIRSPVVRYQSLPMLALLVLETLKVWLGWVPTILGTIHHLIPFVCVRSLAARISTQGKTTIALYRLGLGLPIYAGWYAIVWFGVAGYFQPWIAWVWVIAMPFAGTFALGHWRRAVAFSRLWWRQIGMLFDREKLKDLRNERERVTGSVAQLSDEFNQQHPGLSDSKSEWKYLGLQIFRILFILGMGAVLVLWMTYVRRPNTIADLELSSPDMSRLEVPDLSGSLTEDTQVLLAVIEGVEELEKRALQVREEFASGARNYFRQADNDTVRQLMLSYINYRTALIRLIWKYQNFWQIQDEPSRLQALLIELTSAALLYDTSLKFVTQFNRSPETVAKLNEAEPVWGIPAGLYDTIHRNLLNPKYKDRLEGLIDRYTQFKESFEANRLWLSAPSKALHGSIGESIESIRVLFPQIQGGNIVDHTLDIGSATYYDIQGFVSFWIGKARIRAPRDGQSLIQDVHLNQLKSDLQPGDILIERRNWVLSNAFLPGYWPHAALYVGDADDLIALGVHNDSLVQPHWDKFIQPDAHGNPHVIIEALSPGVILNTIEHSVGGADAVSVLRPRLNQDQIVEAIALAFSHVGKPYDFDFNFFSTDKLVCTELVFRAYDQHIDFPLVDIMGRKTMPAMELLRKFSVEKDLPTSQLQFVAFLDGDERRNHASFRNAEALVDSLNRSSFTWLQTISP